MDSGKKEKVIILAALHQYMKTIEESLNLGKPDEDENADLANRVRFSSNIHIKAR